MEGETCDILRIACFQFYQQMTKRLNAYVTVKNLNTEQLESVQLGIKRLQQTVKFNEKLCTHGACSCMMCVQRNKSSNRATRVKIMKVQGSQDSDKWLKTILRGLVISHATCLKIYIADICFVENNQLEIYQTDPQNNRVKKVPGINSQRSLYQVMVRLRKNYKWMLNQNFKKKQMSDINPNYMHEKHLNQVIPTYFHKRDMMEYLSRPKYKNGEQTYVVHQNKKFLEEVIEQHKLQENEAFCTVKFKDGSSQIFIKAEFEKWMDIRNKNPGGEEISYVQAFIKQKQETQAFFTTYYQISTQGVPINDDFDPKMYSAAEREVMVLLEGSDKYSSDYQDLDTYQDQTIILMNTDIKSYVKLMTYKMIHFLSMASRVYIRRLKINWILNDIGCIYLRGIQEMQTMDLPIKALRYQLPPQGNNALFYKDSQQFGKMYLYVQMLNDRKRKKIRQQMIKQYEEQNAEQEKILENVSTATSKIFSRTTHKPNFHRKNHSQFFTKSKSTSQTINAPITPSTIKKSTGSFSARKQQFTPRRNHSSSLSHYLS